MAQDFGPGLYTEASTLPFFSEAQLLQADDFVATYACAKNSLGYSKRVLGGILFNGTFVGSPMPSLEASFTHGVLAPLLSRIRTVFGDETLQLLSLEYTNQCFKQKSAWHKDMNDGFPYLNIFIPLDDLSAENGMTILKIEGNKIELKASRNHWYSFDGNITHCAGAGTGKAGTPRRALMAVFRRAGDPTLCSLSTANYKTVITKRLNKGKKRPIKATVPTTRVLRSRK